MSPRNVAADVTQIILRRVYSDPLRDIFMNFGNQHDDRKNSISEQVITSGTSINGPQASKV